MPQLDPTSFISQLFWLLITFALLFSMLTWFVAPKLGQVLQNRRDVIFGDLDQAERLKKEAEEIIKEYEASLQSTRTQVRALIAEAAQHAEQEAGRRREELERMLHKKKTEAEARILKARDEAIAGLSGISSDLARQVVEQVAHFQVDKAQAVAAVSERMKRKQA